MTLDMTSFYIVRNEYRQEELARLVLILVTPDPPTGSSSTSSGSTYHAIAGTIAKDALLLLLEGIVQSSDAFPPLKSAASGLQFFATCADVSIRTVAAQTRIGSFLTRQLPAIRSKSVTSTDASTAWPIL